MKENISSSFTVNNVFFKHASGNIGISENIFHSDFELFLVYKGTVDCLYNNAPYRLSPLTLVLIPPGVYHRFIPDDNGENFERFIFEFPPSKLDGLVSAAELEKKRFINLKSDDEIVHIFEKIVYYYANCNSTEFEILFQALFNEIILLTNHTVPLILNSTNTLNPLTRNALNFISENIDTHFSLQSLADALYCSVSSLCHHFKADLGLSVQKFIVQKRLYQARALLLSGVRPNAVWEACGFPDYICFFRTYKKTFGVTPSNDYLRKKS